ncbi:AGC protein kinase [Puccinia sorghi]|uniref:AGC protein kinase n=1 Tax=Puccinia sorghi TaxID=27349 RepID=A0A0L6VGJ0_9BASI|nr:AGC protein kinase [Puccinia sorghi]
MQAWFFFRSQESPFCKLDKALSWASELITTSPFPLNLLALKLSSPRFPWKMSLDPHSVIGTMLETIGGNYPFFNEANQCLMEDEGDSTLPMTAKSMLMVVWINGEGLDSMWNPCCAGYVNTICRLITSRDITRPVQIFALFTLSN